MRDADTGLYMENSTLGNFARNTASALEPEGTVRPAAECAGIYATLRALRARLTPRTDAGETSEAAEWFSDNWYIAEREGKAAARALRGAGRLPRAAGTKRACVALAAGALVRSGRGEVTGERLELFLTEYQKTRPLTERELSVFLPAVMAEECAFLAGVPQEGADAALLMKNVFTTLRTLSTQDLSDILERVDLTEAALKTDPAGVYPRMDEDTRRDYRRELSRLAQKRHITEPEAAKLVLELARKGPERHVGFYLFERPLGEPKSVGTGEGYIAALALTTLFFALLTGVLTNSVWAALLSLLPVSELVKAALDALLLHLVKPRRLPRLELEGGIPKSAGTLCVISALLTKERDGEKYARLLEEYRLANRDAGAHLTFGILADLPEAKTRRTGEDGPVLSRAKAAVEELNRRYGGGFYLFCREREQSVSDGVYRGRERKRGAIEALTKLLSGEESELRVLAGDRDALRGLPFLLTLDADTRLAAGSARELVGAALHPLNTPKLDEKLGRVVSGYGILEPRVGVDLQSANRSDFSRLFAGVGGVDPYGSAVSDLYQDLFSQGTFMGKGLINVPVYRRVLEGVFPEEAVLSHDILEGAYLGCGFLSDVELTDGWPYKVTSYFSRQERWTRGDWQNLGWCTRWVRAGDGSRRRNPLSALSRFKLFDNLRRSMTAPAALINLLLWAVFPSAGTAAAGILGLAAVLSGALLEWAEGLLRHDGSARARYQSAVLPGPGGTVMRSLTRLMLLPAEGWNQLRAAATALWRMYVTRRRRLAWVTSGDAERRHGNTVLVNYRELLACPVAAVLLVLFAKSPVFWAAALVWAFTPLYAWALSRELAGRRRVRPEDRAYLLTRAGEIWKFFADHLTAEDNFLPPDNVQLSPHLGPAHRTSPTNIGLALLSTLAAADLGLIDDREASERAKRTLAGVEKAEKWRGHLYNWMDTRTLAPLEPRYVSAVDSGNLTGALIVLKTWFEAHNDVEAAGRCEKLVENVDFTCLFDKKRKLFHIGWDFLKDAPSEGWYDLLASEARETSFIAVALGQVPRRHWRRLGRARVALDRYSGMASWTGTMFEYLMPNLLLPCEPASLLYESARFCLYAQKRAHPGKPWGISESCFYAFDPGLAYRYKAHGVQTLALKRGMGAETVISPYSTYLALPLDPARASDNLRRLGALGALGPYGHIEALDFTPARTRTGKPEAVRTYMAHHLGMSLVAIANTLCDDVFPRRFMADRRMAAFRELLEERLPTGRLTLRQPPRDIPAAPDRREAQGVSRAFTSLCESAPACLPLAAGEYALLFAETGKTRSRWRGLELTAFDPDPEGEAGMEIALRTPAGTLPVAPARPGAAKYACELTDLYGRLRAKALGVTAALTVTVPPSGMGEVRTLDIAAPAGVAEVTAVVSFEPVLRRRADYEAHPAFNRLTLEARLEDGALTVARRGRAGEAPAALALAADRELTAATHRGRGEPPESGELLPYSPDMRVGVAVTVPLRQGRGRVTFALAAGETAAEAARAARRMVRAPEPEPLSRLAAAALMLGMKPSDTRAALDLITPLLFGGETRKRPDLGREELWRVGLSGDLPILGARIPDADAIPAALDLVRRHALLAENGVEADLLLVLTDHGDYAAAQRTAIADLLRRLGRESTLDAPGGVHLVPDPVPALELAEVKVDLTAPWTPPARPLSEARPSPLYTPSGTPAAYRRGASDQVLIALQNTLPPAAWSHILTNPAYGFLATECGAGFQWSQNSRLYKISPWVNDERKTQGPETLKLLGPQGEESLFADGGPAPALIEYGFGWARWERDFGPVRSRLTAFVPWEVNARVMVLELNGELENMTISYACKLLLGESGKDAKFVRISFENGTFTAKTTTGAFRNSPYTLLISAPAQNASAGDTLAFTLPASPRLVLVSGCDKRQKLEAALRVADRLLEETKARWQALTSALRVETPEPRLDAYLNGWALYQTRAARLLARTGLYQNGGAVGFRDQLQDAAAMTLVDREPAVWQLRQAAAHQYAEGDVMHWWHPTPEGDRGVRTRCSDDLLWLVWALHDYVTRTGDTDILRAREPYRLSAPLEAGERDRYERPEIGAETDTLLNHALRAAACFLRRGTGAHGLALMLGGDWNDGMDRVGADGRGESVWLTFFGAMALEGMAELCEKAGEAGRSGELRAAAGRYLRAAEGAFAGEWYLRGFYGDGAPLGAPGDGACALDSVAQSFAHFAGADRARVKRALRAAAARLFDPESGTAALFDPPFDKGERDPGYIASYAPGTRENGGQYTHAAVWLAMALLESGERETGARLLAALSPWGRDIETYAAEPYVLAADVYRAPGLTGRGGWSWYTGSAGWYFRAVTESLFGLRLRDGVLTVKPNLPDSMLPASLTLRLESGEIAVNCYPEGILVNGEPYRGEGIRVFGERETAGGGKV